MDAQRKKGKRKSNKIRKLKEGKRLAMSMISTVHGISGRIDRLERITNKILDNLGKVGEYIKESEGRIRKIESTWYRRFWRWITRKG